MLKPSRLLLLLSLAASLATLGCHAQTPAGKPAPGLVVPQPAAFRIEVLLRQKANLPPGSTIAISTLTPSNVPGFHTVSVTFTNDGRSSHPVEFLLSDDYNQLEQVTRYDLSADTRKMLSPLGRPHRGGPDTAPVIIVGFDDLECPFCARLHAAIFPAITNRYGDKVHIVYKEYPLVELHPWAMHAAVDVNCMADQSSTGYWNLVDSIHAHASGIASDPANPAAEKTLPRAVEQLDKLTHDEAVAQKLDVPRLEACLRKQDTAPVDAMVKLGTSLSLESTPTLFINGDKIDGSVPIEFLFSVIDNALLAENIQPPPPYIPPTPPTPPPAPQRIP